MKTFELYTGSGRLELKAFFCINHFCWEGSFSPTVSHHVQFGVLGVFGVGCAVSKGLIEF